MKLIRWFITYIKENKGTGEVMQESHYYPFGMLLEGMSYQNPLQESVNKFLYNGKEIQDDLGLDWYDYGARFYDATLGRWHSVDPMAEKYNDISPYCYVANMPITAIDPDGRTISIIGSKEYDQQVRFQLALLAAKSNKGYELVMDAIGSKNKFVIAEGNSDAMKDFKNQVMKGGDGIKVLFFDAMNSNGVLSGGEGGFNQQEIKTNGQTTLAHELTHFLDDREGTSTKINGEMTDLDPNEVLAVENENIVRRDLGMEPRAYYGGYFVHGKNANYYEYKSGNKTIWGYNLENKSDYAVYNKTFSTHDRNNLLGVTRKRFAYNKYISYGLYGSIRKFLKNPEAKTHLLIYMHEKK